MQVLSKILPRRLSTAPMPAIIPVALPDKPYNIAIAPNAIDDLGGWLAGQFTPSLSLGQKVMVVSNPVIFKHYGARAIASLEASGFAVSHCILAPGERYKTPNTVLKIHNAALENRLERSSTMVALGGGVIGDMTGFAAATWLRGINVVQVPTSLLAMVDAAIGGKTGVNHPQGKNLIGAFHQPRLVLIDPQVLKTLPVREFRAAIAEVIKYGVIGDAKLFEQLEAAQGLDSLDSLGDELLQDLLQRSCQAKALVVSKDEKESGLREILNYGHTIGHAVESLMHYKGVNHGEAVGIGMVAVGQLAANLQFWDQTSSDRQLQLVQKAKLPSRLPPGIALDDILTALQMDKKVKSGQVRFVLPNQIGAAIVTDQVPTDAIRAVLQEMAA
jgi:3-dehydroquinate synthase